MSDWEELVLDEMEVDTTLAQKYFEEKNKIFTSMVNGEHGVIDTNTNDYILDPCDNKIFYSHENVTSAHKLKFIKPNNMKTLAGSIRQLAKEIMENGELFCQLEYAVRKYPLDSVQNCELLLLINHCLDWSSILYKYSVENDEEADEDYITICMEGKPLSALANVVHELMPARRVVLKSTPETAAICTLFTELCAQVGLDHLVSLRLVKDGVKVQKSDSECCIGIVTETADLDSAVETFITSTKVCQLTLTGLLVQESVYEDFKRALEWKCRLNVTDEHQLDLKLKDLCADVQVVGGHVFLLDYAGHGDVQAELNPVKVEAYRTSKELLTIMSEFTESYVSLWCSDAAQANEIAVSLSSPFVWINSYAVLNGPPQSARSHIIIPGIEIEDGELSEMADAWLQLDVDKRREVMFETLQAYVECNTDDARDDAVRVQTLLGTQKLGFVEVNKNDMWIGIESPVGLVCVDIQQTEHFVDAVASIVHGNRVLLSPDYEHYSPLIDCLRNAGIPIEVSSIYDRDSSIYYIYKTKVIYTNFGTIFAN